ncbi:expressed unknown protein [Seminavis robusta]|uniref:Uncharacterized protein n=1 Tax=Seminavis robusta TaxID=568900 RepID=A0A9N8ERN8_9STRA|nr:expressed unknown protein [Seminavis robusta]|eukprot:Sro1495_g277380.1 n/a (320) ;mRNA; f:645-1604
MAKGQKRKNESVTDENPNPKEKKSSNEEKEKALLGNLLRHFMKGNESVSFKECSEDLGFMERTKTWQAAWRSLAQQRHIEAPEANPIYGAHKLTDQGKEFGATDEYKEFLEDQRYQPKTNEEHQTRLKKRLDKKSYGENLFDLLLEHGSLSRKEMSGIVGVVSGSHKFSYGFKDLKDLGFMEIDPADKKKWRLTEMVFLNPEDRPEQSDPKEIEMLIAATAGAKKAKKTDQEKPKKKAAAKENAKEKKATTKGRKKKKQSGEAEEQQSTTIESPIVHDAAGSENDEESNNDAAKGGDEKVKSKELPEVIPSEIFLKEDA